MKRTLRPETLLRRFKTFCVLDRRRIPRKRQRRNAVTCTRDCQKQLTKLRKLARDHRQCSHCGRPSSPGERAEFRRWRASGVSHAHPKKGKAAKGIRGVANSTQKMSDFAYVVELGPKKRGAPKHRKGAA